MAPPSSDPVRTDSTASAPDNGELHAAVAYRLGAAGQRYTTGRRHLVEVLAEAGRPLSIVDILRVVDMPRSSAYRHLTVLAASGVVHRITGPDDLGFFELTDELSGDHHHHVLCGDCGSVADIPAAPALEKALEEAARLAMKQTGFAIDAHRIDLVGTCGECQRQ